MGKLFERLEKFKAARLVPEILGKNNLEDSFDRYGNSALVLASKGGHKEIVKELIRHKDRKSVV